MSLSVLRCRECGFKFPIQRQKRKEKRHVKHMHCVKCKKITGHIENF